MQTNIPLLVVCGPTASGKTGLAIALAQEFDGEVVSADSMQIYRGMDIGTAKPTPEEMQGVVHHMLDILEPGESYSVAQFVEQAGRIIADIHARGKLPILAGGTGLYIDSLTRNLQFPEIADDPELRQSLYALAQQEGNEAVWRLLEQCDPELAQKLHPNNLGRVVRAVEVYRATGVAQSEWQRRSTLLPPPYRVCMLGLDWPRETLYRRIDQRVDIMLEQGLAEEAERFYRMGLSSTAAQAIGYKELFRVFAGEQTLDEAAETVKRETRRYAKRQLTWFRRDERIHWLHMDDETTSAELLERAAALVRADLGLNKQEDAR